MILDLVSYGAFFLTMALTFAIICLGLNVQWGQTGLFNVGVAGFVAIGAYTSALLTAPASPERAGSLGWPIVAGWLGAVVASGAAALGVGALTLRLRHDYLAIATFGVSVTIQLLALNLVRLTGGPFGVHGVPRPFSGVIASPLGRNVAYVALVIALVAVVYGLLERLVASPWGRVLRSIREDEAAAAALGKSPAAFRLQAFTLGAMVMGLAGAVYAHFIGFVAPEDFLSILTFQVWTMLIVGGSGNNRGAIAGAVAVWALWTMSGAALVKVLPQAIQARGAALQTVAIGVALAAVLLVRPRGLFGEATVVSRHAGPG
jgi:branched-chain amino acid transport system permease protein